MPDGTPKPKAMKEYAINMKKTGASSTTVARKCLEKFGVSVHKCTVDNWFNEHQYGKVETETISRTEVKLDDYKKKQANILFLKRNLRTGSVIEVLKMGFEDDEPKRGVYKKRVSTRVQVQQVYSNFILCTLNGARETFGYDEVLKIVKL